MLKSRSASTLVLLASWEDYTLLSPIGDDKARRQLRTRTRTVAVRGCRSYRPGVRVRQRSQNLQSCTCMWCLNGQQLPPRRAVQT